MNYKWIILTTVGLLTYCGFNLNAQDKYFYEQYAWNFNQNGRDILLIDDTIRICGNTITTELNKWDSFILEIDQEGNLIKINNFLKEDVNSHFRKMFWENNQLKVIGDTYYPNGEQTNIYASIFYGEVENFSSLIVDKNTPPNRDMEAAISIEDGFIVGGFSYYPEITLSNWLPYLIKLDKEGNVVWEIEFEEYEFLYTINKHKMKAVRHGNETKDRLRLEPAQKVIGINCRYDYSEVILNEWLLSILNLLNHKTNF